MQKPMLFTLFTLNTCGIRLTSPWQVVHAVARCAMVSSTLRGSPA